MLVRVIYSLQSDDGLRAETLTESLSRIGGNAAGKDIKEIPGLGAIIGNRFTAKDVHRAVEWIVSAAKQQKERYTMTASMDAYSVGVRANCQRAINDAKDWENEFIRQASLHQPFLT